MDVITEMGIIRNIDLIRSIYRRITTLSGLDL